MNYGAFIITLRNKCIAELSKKEDKKKGIIITEDAIKAIEKAILIVSGELIIELKPEHPEYLRDIKIDIIHNLSKE